MPAGGLQDGGAPLFDGAGEAPGVTGFDAVQVPHPLDVLVKVGGERAAGEHHAPVSPICARANEITTRVVAVLGELAHECDLRLVSLNTSAAISSPLSSNTAAAACASPATEAMVARCRAVSARW